MKHLSHCLLAMSLVAALALSAMTVPSPPLLEEAEARPWIRWWWPGSAVDDAGLTRQLEQFAQAGLGGVEITPIYGAKGAEDRYLEFLSPRYLAALEHVGREAKRLGLGVDMATCTGWPFGGPWVTESDASEKLVFVDGRLTGEPTRMMVKRAAPGGEGRVLDPYSTGALGHYLAPFDAAFARFPRGLIRAQFHDSFEYYGANWTPRFAEAFRGTHGYDVQRFGAELLGQKPLDADTLGRLKCDYRETLARLHLDYIRAWSDWCHRNGFRSRDQAHGAPANLLDVYAAADIPETETFGSTPLPIPGLRRAADEIRADLAAPEPLLSKFASSAGHVAGRRLISSESCTWLRSHWKETLADAKPELDRVLLAGINHIVYHGAIYSPPDLPWPGWLFYASTQFNPNNPWWDDFSALNAYVGRVQSMLQSGIPANDVLVYWPVFDIWSDPAGLELPLGVHSTAWILETPFGRLAKKLKAQGFSFDYVSDEQLRQVKWENGNFVTAGGAHYRALVVPATKRMPVETLRQVFALGQGGGNVIFEAVPEEVSGLGRLEMRRAEFRTLVDQLGKRGTLVAADVPAALRQAGVPREPIAESGIGFIRRARKSGYLYFLVNQTAQPLDGWVTLGTQAHSVRIIDPVAGCSGLAEVRGGKGGVAQVYLQIAPGESVLLDTIGASALFPAKAIDWHYLAPAGEPVEIAGEWRIEFIKGGPVLPPPLQTKELKSWTELGGEEAQRFGGTARYRIEFNRPAVAADEWVLDLGDVRESARVRLNGTILATAWSLPFAVRLGSELQPGRNVLELEVTNLAANRIRDLDRRGVPWKIMREINFVDINYQPFDASNWPLQPSGLLGPVRLRPMKQLDPGAR